MPSASTTLRIVPSVPDSRPALRQSTSRARIAARRGNTIVFLEASAVWAFQAKDSATLVHAAEGAFDLDVPLGELEMTFCRRLLRVHRSWLVDPAHVRAFDRDTGQAYLFVGEGVPEQGRGFRVPVSRERVMAVRGELLANTTGLRPRAEDELA